MRRYLGRGIAIVAVLVFGLASAAIADEEAVPKIEIDEMRHDFGDIFEKEKFKHTFKVRNAGTADLEIKSVKPG